MAIVGTAVAGIALVKAHGKSSLLKDATEKLKSAEDKIMIEKGYAASDLQEEESENIINDILNYLNDKK